MVRASAAPFIDKEWCDSLVLESGLFRRESFESVQISGCASRVAVPGELVRLHLDLADDIPLAAQVRCLLRCEIEPFIIGVGDVIVQDTPEGIIVLRRDSRVCAAQHQTLTSR
jgi:hypothetical protein